MFSGVGVVMGKGSKSGGCKSASHQLFKDKAKNRVDDLQGMFTNLQSARKESRTIDVAVLEEQVHQMLREWKSELNEPSPASSLQVSIFSLCNLVHMLLYRYLSISVHIKGKHLWLHSPHYVRKFCNECC